MSSFRDFVYCVTCEKRTTHWFMDDTPRRHRYTANCSICDTTFINDLSYSEAMTAITKDEEIAKQGDDGVVLMTTDIPITIDRLKANVAADIDAKEDVRFTTEERAILVKAARIRRDAIMRKKGADYAGSTTNANDNFYRNALAIGVSPNVVWSIYYNKHHDSLMTFIKTGTVESEGIRSRLDDMQNYLDILETMLIEQGVLDVE